MMFNVESSNPCHLLSPRANHYEADQDQGGAVKDDGVDPAIKKALAAKNNGAKLDNDHDTLPHSLTQSPTHARTWLA